VHVDICGGVVLVQKVRVTRAKRGDCLGWEGFPVDISANSLYI
jgi:hypothetical protein